MPARAAEGRRSRRPRHRRRAAGRAEAAGRGAQALQAAYPAAERDSTVRRAAVDPAGAGDTDGPDAARDAAQARARRQGLGDAAQGRRHAARTSTRASTPPRPPPRSVRRRRRSMPRHCASIAAPRSRRTPSSKPTKGTIEIELAVLDAPLTVAQLHRAGPQRLLQRPRHPSRRARLRGPGWRSARRRRRRPGLLDSRRAQRAAVSARHRRHGARLARHRRQPVLHHPLAAAAPRRAATRCSAAW